MFSGLDTDRIIQELVKNQKAKVDNAKKSQTSNQWKQDAWKALNTKALALFRGPLSTMRFSDAYAKKTSSVSNPAKATVVTGGTAVNGVQTLEIRKLATTGYMTGKKITTTDNKKVDTTTRLSALGVGNGSTISIKVGNKTTDITVNENTTMQSVVNSLKAAGVNANFDVANGRLFISSTAMGASSNFSIIAKNAEGLNALDKLGINFHDTENYDHLSKLAGIVFDNEDDVDNGNVITNASHFEGFITEEIAKLKTRDEAALAAYDTNITNMENGLKAKLEAKLNEYRDWMLGWLNDDPTGNAAEIAELEGFNWTVEGDVDAMFEKMEGLIGDSEHDSTDVYDYSPADYDADEAVIAAERTARGDLNTKIGRAGEPLSTNPYKAEAEAIVRENIKFAKNVLYGSIDSSIGGEDGGRYIAGQDSEIFLNNVRYTSTNNTFSINGLTINALQTTAAGEPITITTEDDTQGIYDMVKNFIKEYNILINEMDRLYNAESAGSYKPLTDEEKEALSEKEIEKWEDKIKESLLRRDSSLYRISNAMKMTMMNGATIGGTMVDGVRVGGTKMYLSTFGIDALSYFAAEDNEKNAYYIDGEDNEKANLLLEAIAKNPKQVTEFFVELTRNLYATMDSVLMDRNSDFKSMNTIYNDKQLKKEYDKLQNEIAKQEEKLIKLEDKYYKQFSAMEVAMAKLQSSQTALSGLLGMGYNNQ
jgi:flagellar hook-associated protein 2